MKILSVKFIKSSKTIEDCPVSTLPEYAFAGRSNVGKSSLINMLLGNKKIAKTSSTPGKTQLLNHFLVNDEWYLCDLPGYGYAKSSKKEKTEWGEMSKQYVLKREKLTGVFVLIDSRLPPQQNDLGFLRWIGSNNIPFVIVFTKVDKLTRSQLETNINSYKKILLEDWEELPVIFLTSSDEGKGKKELLDFIKKTNEEVKKSEI